MSRTRRTVSALLAGLAASVSMLVACSTDPDAGAAAGSCVTVDPLKELLVVDPAVLEGPAASNAGNGALSFRRSMTLLTPPGQDPQEFVGRWLRSFVDVQIHGLDRTLGRPRLTGKLLCPWLKQTPANACDADCSACKGTTLDLALAPFRLIAVVNRIDIPQQKAAAGESRLVYAFTDGPGDDPASVPWRATAALEFRNPATDGRDFHYWANRWHDVAAGPYDPAVMATKLTSLFDEVRDCSQPACSLGQLRTNEIEFDWLWQLREYVLVDGVLTMAPLEKTPRRELSGSAELATFLSSNRRQIIDDELVVPPPLFGFAVSPLSPSDVWRAPGVDADLRQAFARQTCDGCHLTEEKSLDVNFHVSPFRKGADSLSEYLRGSATNEGELARRSQKQARAICSP